MARHEFLRVPQDLRWPARHNQLLAALPAPDCERLRHTLEPVALPLGHVLGEAGCHASYAYFPVTGIVSLTQQLASGATAEVALVGNDGVVGIALVMSDEPSTTRAFVRAAGMGYRLCAAVLEREFEQCRSLRRILLVYALSLFTQVAQTAVCRGHHSVEQQVCRILLATAERSGSDDLALTQELIAELVGVRRESVTTAAGMLQAEGVIRYHHGLITVLDRPALARHACECRAAFRSKTQPAVVAHGGAHELALEA